MMGFGAVVMLMSVAMAVYFVIDKILHPEIANGWTSLVALTLFFGGLQTVFMGLIGEYIGKNYLDQNGTPQFTVKKTYGIAENEEQSK